MKMIVYGDLESGNCLKVKYVADYVNVPYEWIPVDIMKGESRTPEFLQRNPAGQVPVVELDDGRCLAQSNAILRYLGRESALIPGDPYLQAKMDELLFWEQYSHEPYIAVCRFQMVYEKRSLEKRDQWRVERAEHALDLMHQHLGQREWFVGDAFSLADISLLAYTRLAPEGGFDLSTRPQLIEWIRRCESALGLA
jgi:glutathione S-transferase